MADIMTTYREHLLSKTEVTTTDASTRIGFDEALQSWKNQSFILLHLISTEPINHLTDSTGFGNSRIQVDCVSEDPATARAIADAVWQVTHTFVGTMGSSNTLRVSVALADIGATQLDSPAEKGAQYSRRVQVVDVRIKHAITATAV